MWSSVPLPSLDQRFDQRVGDVLVRLGMLATDFPDTRIILNHAGLPADRSAEGLASWKRAMATFSATESHAEMFAEATHFMPEPTEFKVGPDQYFEGIRRASRR